MAGHILFFTSQFLFSLTLAQRIKWYKNVPTLFTSAYYKNQQVPSEGASTKPPCIIGGSPPFSRRRGAARHRPSSVRPSSARRLLSSFCCPHSPLRPSVRSFRGVAQSLTPLPLPLSPRSLARSSTKPHHRCTFVRSLARFDRPSLSPSISLPSFVHSNRVECRSFLTLCAGKLKHFRQNFEVRTHFAPIPTRMSCRPPSYLHVEKGPRGLGTFIICPPASAVNRGCGIERTNERNASVSANKRPSWRGPRCSVLSRFLPSIGPPPAPFPVAHQNLA